MPAITFNAFRGANTALDDTLLPVGVGVVSTNQLPGRDDLRPWNAPGTAVATVPSSPQRLALYRMGQDAESEANYWLGWSTVVNVERGFDSTDPTERVYFTGSGSPKWTNNVIGLSGGPPYPQATRELAVPAPVGAATAVLNTDGPSGTAASHNYVYTYVNDLGWESAPSPVSNTVSGKPAATFDLSGFSSVPAGNYGITLVRLYKLVTSSNGDSDWFFEREWSAGSPPANPIDDARALGSDPIATVGWLVPPSDGYGLKALWNGMLALLTGKSMRICEPYKPYAWPLAYEVVTQAVPVAVAVIGQRAIVLTKGDATVVVGSSPDAMDDEPANLNRPCSSARSVVEFNEEGQARGAVWASENGLCWYGDGGFRDLTADLLDPDDWRALDPSTMVATRHRGLYLCFYDDGAQKGFAIDPRNPTGIYWLATGYDAVARDPLTDRFYVLDGGDVRRWNAGSAMTATFKSKRVELPAPIALGWVEVIAKDFPATVKTYVNGSLLATTTVADGEPYRLPDGIAADTLQCEVSCAGRVIAVRYAPDVRDLLQP